jgi:predicted secreted protein
MSKYSAFGTTLKRGGTGGTAIAQIQSISGPGLAADTEDVTTHDSTGGWEEAVVTILRSGEVTIDILYDPNAATHKNAAGGLLADLISRASQTYAITFPSSAAVSWTFTAFVTGFEPGAPFDGALTAAVTLKLTGQPTLA